MTLAISKRLAGTGASFALVLFAGILMSPPRGHADNGTEEASKIQQGFAIAPVPLNLSGKNHDLVGLGSYIVNAANDCNFCHTSGGPPNFNFANNFNPYFGQKKMTDPTTYLGGGAPFGTALPFNVPPGLGYGSYLGPVIVSRNLTPDKTGLPEGGHTLAQFTQILRTGVDMDHLHPTCTTASPTPSPANCIPPPVDGALLQVMPWPDFQDMTDHDIEAIWTYLSAIPCVAGPPAPSPLHNNCR
jgi:hypothetical protein